MEVERFTDIEEEFIGRTRETVWCNMATVDRGGRPYSRIIHPLWEGSIGWILTHRDSHKSKQLADNPYVSLSYIRGDIQHPVYADCRAEWVESVDEKERIWALFRSEPEPVGFDPAPIFGSPSDHNAGLLKLTPWRIDLVTYPAESMDAGSRVWRNERA